MPAPASRLAADALANDVARIWDDEIVPELVEYIRIPNESPLFDPDWAAHGHMDRAVAHIARWCRARPIPGLTVEIVRLEGRTPVILMEIPGATSETVLLYGHLDKQPPMSRVARGPGSLDPGHRGRQAVRPRGRGRRLRCLRVAHRRRGAWSPRGHPRPVRRAHRSMRRKRQLRPAGLHGGAGRPHRFPDAGRVPGLGMWQLRPALVYDIAAGHRRRHAVDRHPDRGRSLGGCQRRGALLVSDRPRAAVAPGRRVHGSAAPCGPSGGRARGPSLASAPRRRGARTAGVGEVPVRRRRGPGGHRAGRFGARAHLGRGAFGDGRGRHPFVGSGRQRPSTGHGAQVVVACATDPPTAKRQPSH